MLLKIVLSVNTLTALMSVPVDCFREGPNMLVIDPEECIDCTLCVAECPVDAIYSEDDLPDDQKDFLEINARLSKIGHL